MFQKMCKTLLVKGARVAKAQAVVLAAEADLVTAEERVQVQAFFARNPPKSTRAKFCGNEFWPFGNEFWTFGNEFQAFWK